MPRVVVRNARHNVIADTHVQSEPIGHVIANHPQKRLVWREVFSPEAFTVTVVIPTTNSPDCLVRQAVDSLPGDVDVILVLTKPDWTDVSWCSHPRLRVLRDLEDPFCFARANNVGARAASTDVILFLNDDCTFRSPNDVAVLCETLHDPSVGEVGALATYAGNSDMKAFTSSPPGDLIRTWKPLNGFCVALRRRLFWAVGGWDERYRGYGTDDDDLTVRVMQAHYRLVVCRKLIVDHVGHHSFGRDWEKIRSEIQKWGAVFEEKWGFPSSEIAERHPDPVATVVIPAYNCERWILPCLESVMAQDCSERFDVVVVNDGSTDGTREVVDAAREVHNQGDGGRYIASLRQPNRGVAAARNRGVRRALGKSVVFQDADDIMPPDRIRLQLEHLRECDLSYGQLSSFIGDDEPGVNAPMKNVISPHPDVLFSGNGFRIGTAAAHREVFDDHGVWLDERMAACEDHEWLVHVVAKGLVAECSDHIFLWRRSVSGSLRTRVDYRPLREHVGKKHSKLRQYIQENHTLPPRGEDLTI